MTDPITEFLKRGGRISGCPTAAASEGSGVIPAADRKRLAEHREERKEKTTFRWGHQKERRRSERNGD
jgi:hypothetical protein